MTSPLLSHGLLMDVYASHLTHCVATFSLRRSEIVIAATFVFLTCSKPKSSINTLIYKKRNRFICNFVVDLVTLDDLSAEAMLESSQRIEQLAEVFRQKQEPMSDPGPPSTLPMTVRTSNCFVQGFVLFT